MLSNNQAPSAPALSRIADINVATASGAPAHPVVLNDTMYFLAYEPNSGYGLWRSDGTPGGTAPVKVVAPRPGFDSLVWRSDLVQSGGMMYFENYDAAHGWELWKSDGTEAGTSMVADLNAGPADSNPSGIAVLNGKVICFTRDTASNAGLNVWVSDGTAAGTTKVTTITPSSDYWYVSDVAVTNNLLFFRIYCYRGQSGPYVYRTDGTAAGTFSLFTAPATGALYGHNFFTLGNRLAYAFANSTNPTMYLTDGSAPGVQQTVALAPGAGVTSSTILGVAGGKVYLGANYYAGTAKVFASDGTGTAGAQVPYGGYNDAPSKFTADDNLVAADAGNAYFTAMDGAYLYQLNGGYASEMVGYLNPSAKVGALFYSSATHRLYYSYNNGTTGAELWESHAYQQASLLDDIRPGAAGSSPNSFVDYHGRTYFAADDGVHGSELWTTDGTTAGTHLAVDLDTATTGSYPNSPIALGRTILFAANDGVHGSELWRTDGTAAGTALVKDIDPRGTTGSGAYGSAPKALGAVNGWAFFAATDASGTELWRSDGTAAGTVMVKDIYPGQGSSSPSQAVALGGVLYFMANDGTHGNQLWRSDGTDAGTYALTSGSAVGPFTFNGTTTPFAVALDDRTLLFVGPNATLWKTDGTVAGTVPLGASTLQGVNNLTRSGGYAYFTVPTNAYNTFTSGNLYRTDGTTTTLVAPLGGSFATVPNYLTDVNGTLYFAQGAATSTSSSSPNPATLWKTDGTAAGTVQVSALNPSGSPRYANLTNLNGRLAFTADDGTNGQNLWITDGTPAGTYPVADINPGAGSSAITSVAASNGLLYFGADDGTGKQPWVSDGTAAGTLKVATVMPTTLGDHLPYAYNYTAAAPAAFLPYDGGVFVQMTDDLAGAEPWLIASDGPPAVTDAAYDPATRTVTLHFNVPMSPDNFVDGGFEVTDRTTGQLLSEANGDYAIDYDPLTQSGTVRFTNPLPAGDEFTVVPAAPGVQSATGRDLTWDYSFGFLATTAPARPTVSAGASGGAHVIWPAVGTAGSLDGLRVQRSADGVNFTTVATLSPTATQWDDAAALPGRAYLYRVQGFQGEYGTPWSAAGGVLVMPPGGGATGNNVYANVDADGVHLDLWVNATIPGQAVPTQQLLRSGVSSLRIFAAAGSANTLTWDGSNGAPLPSGSQFVGGGSDAVSVVGTAGDDVVTAAAFGLTFGTGAAATTLVTNDLRVLRLTGGSGGQDVVNVTGGSWQVDADTPAGTPNVSVSVSGAATVASFGPGEHLANLTVADGTVQLTTGTLSLAGPLTITGNGKVDLRGGILLAPTTPDLAAYVARAAGAVQANGLNAWTGGGLTSSFARADAASGNAKELAVGCFDSRDNGQTGLNVPPGQTLVTLTVYGDATGDGKVSIADLSVWNNNFGTANPRWSQGDFNYDGKVNIADLSVWNNDFGNSAPAMTGASAPAVAAAGAVASTAAATEQAPPLPSQPVTAMAQVVPTASVMPTVPTAAVVLNPQPHRRRRLVAWRRVAKQCRAQTLTALPSAVKEHHAR